MKKIFSLFSSIFIILLSSCAKLEDGDINEWIGTYEWSANYYEKWYYSLGTKGRTEYKEYPMDKTCNFIIKEDKTWHMPDPKGPGKFGSIKCYKNYINLLSMNNDYNIQDSFNFVIQSGEVRDFLVYEKNTDPHVGDHYEYEIRKVSFIKINS